MRSLITIICLFLFLGCENNQGSKQIESAHVLAKSMDYSTEIGITQSEFRKKLVELNTETSLAAQQAKSESDIRKVKKLKEILSIYEDSLVLWNNLNDEELKGQFQAIDRSRFNIYVNDLEKGGFDPSSGNTEYKKAKIRQIYDIVFRQQSLIIERKEYQSSVKGDGVKYWWIISIESPQKLWKIAKEEIKGL